MSLVEKEEEIRKEFKLYLGKISDISKLVISVVDSSEINMSFNIYDMFEQFSKLSKEQDNEGECYKIKILELV